MGQALCLMFPQTTKLYGLDFQNKREIKREREGGKEIDSKMQRTSKRNSKRERYREKRVKN